MNIVNYRHGEITNYSMGISAYTCFIMVAAPMHDIGKIAIPDAILKKPGKLTAEEYEVMKTHSAKGGEIIEGTCKEIPLSARIMAVADVFDAVSAKRCYRDAMPLEECFEIIENRSGQDFDPMIVEVFLDMRDEIAAIVSNQ